MLRHLCKGREEGGFRVGAGVQKLPLIQVSEEGTLHFGVHQGQGGDAVSSRLREF